MLKKQSIVRYFIPLCLWVASCFSAAAYNFSAATATSQVLYYEILTDSTVAVTYPNHVGGSYYSGYTIPSGNLLIPSTVTYASSTYKVVSIGNHAFHGCPGLVSIIFPNSIETIGDNACASCSGLVSVYFSNSVTSIGDNAFQNCSALTSLSLPNSVSLIGVSAFQGCSALSSLTLGNNITTIGPLAFEGCSSLTAAAIPNLVSMLGNWAFCNCVSLDSLSIGISVAAIQPNTFAGCANVRYLNYGCRNSMISTSALPVLSLRKLVVGDSVQSVSAYAFAGANHLKSIYIGTSLASIGAYAFDGCDSLATVECRRMVPPTIQPTTFSSTSAALYVPCLSVPTYQSTDNWADFASMAAFFPYILQLSSNDTLRGVVSILQQPTCANSTVRFQAVANAGYHFLSWSDGATENPRQINLSADYSIVAQFVSDYSFINVASNDTNYGSVQGAGRYIYESSVTLRAMPKYGYHFVRWTDGSLANPRTVSVCQDSVFGAVFAPNEYLVSVIPSDTTMGSASGSGTYEYSTAVVISAAPAYGYHFAMWSDSVSQNPRTLLVSTDTNLVAIFVPNSYMAAISSNDTAMGHVLGGGQYDYLSAATLQAIPQEHHLFQQWSDGVVDNPRHLVLISDTNLCAIFQPRYYQLACPVNDSSMGSVSGIGAYRYHQTVAIQAYPTAHHHFVSWSDGVTSNPRLVDVISDTTLGAIFAEYPKYHIVAESSDPELGRATGSGDYYYADTVMLVATPFGEHIEFQYWSDGCTDNPRHVQILEDATYTAVFGLEQYSLELSANDNNLGLLYGAGNYPYATVVTAIAVPYPYAKFSNWSDGVKTNPRSITITSDITLQAHFRYLDDNLGIDSPENAGGVITLNNRHLSVTGVEGIAIYDIQGRRVASSANGELSHTFNTAGIYLVQIKGAQPQKIVVR